MSRIGFVGWNPFQLLHIKKLIKALPGTCFILEKRADYIKEFDDTSLSDPSVPVLVWPREKMGELDGMFDILVCQTVFSKIQNFTRTRIAMIQYGYAKEAHNYGPWRALSCLSLAYGNYAARKLGHYSPTLAVGNPRYDDWFDESFHASAKSKYATTLDPTKKTILYAPTWGDLSSVDKYAAEIFALGGQYNVLVKMHHNTALLEANRAKNLSGSRVSSFGANTDLMELLAVSDVVVSDYSGAMFDALFCRKPVVLLDLDLSDALGKKTDTHSLEYESRDMIGLRVSHPGGVEPAIQQALDRTAEILASVESFRQDLFVDAPGATERAAKALQDLSAGLYTQNQLQSYVRAEIIEGMKIKARLKTFMKKEAVGKSGVQKPAAKSRKP